MEHVQKEARIRWARTGGYEVSSKGDSRFSALFARMPDGRTIEQWYQCDIKGYQPGGRDWQLGKGKPGVYGMTKDDLWEMYLSLWKHWALLHLPQMLELQAKAQQHNNTLSDRFATTEINQARALTEILNRWFV